MAAQVIPIRSFQMLRCTDVPQSERCTERLHQGECPGNSPAKGVICVSTKFDPQTHNLELPKFFAAQH